MALPSNVVWRMHSTANADNNGGGFVPGGSGTDYTQQDTPQISVTDAVTNGTTTVTSATANFPTDIVNNLVNIVEGGNNVWYHITARNSATSITVDRNTVGSGSGRTLKAGGANKIDQGGIAFQGFLLPGHIVDAKGSFTHIVNEPTIASSGSSDDPIIFRGFGTTPGDSGRCTFSPGAGTLNGLVVSGSNIVLRNVIVDMTGRSFTGLLISGNKNIAYNCIGKRGTGDKIKCTGEGGQLIGCFGDGNSENGRPIYVTGANWTLSHCVARRAANNAGISIDTSGTAHTWVTNCISYENNDEGLVIFFNATGGYTCRNNILWDNNRDNFRFGSNTDSIKNCEFSGNILGKATTYEINHPWSDISALKGSIEWAKMMMRQNAFYLTGTAKYNNISAGSNDITLTADPFVDSANGNFALNATAGGGPLVQNNLAVFPYSDDINTGYYISGALGSLGAPAPNAPTNLLAVLVGNTQANLSWTDNSSDEIAFLVERSVNGGAFSVIGATGPGITSYSDKGLLPSNFYSYRVRAVN